MGKKLHNSLKIDPNFFFQYFKIKLIFNFVKLWLHKKEWQQIFFTPDFFLLFWDPGWVKSGSGIQDKNPGSATRVLLGYGKLRWQPLRGIIINMVCLFVGIGFPPLPTPICACEWCSSPFGGGGGRGDKIAYGGGGGVDPIPAKGQKLWYSMYPSTGQSHELEL